MLKNRFNLISWGITGIVVLLLVGVAIWQLLPARTGAIAEATSTAATGVSTLPELESVDGDHAMTITRRANMRTVIPTHESYDVVEYVVSRGDSLFYVASEYNIEPETLYWANAEVFAGSPDNLSPGDILIIPPTDGVYYEWKDGDTFESVAEAFDVEPEVIVDWPGNNIDLTEPQVLSGSHVMVPGGEEDDQPLFITTVTRESSALAAACGGGYIGRGYFTWPTPMHSLSGYDYATGHLGIDITAVADSPIYAADNGVVTLASYGWNYGYGNVIQVDHGNGYISLYAHLNSIFVGECQSVMAGATIGGAGSTGNSSGTHLHFEIRLGGVGQNPWFYLP